MAERLSREIDSEEPEGLSGSSRLSFDLALPHDAQALPHDVNAATQEAFVLEHKRSVTTPGGARLDDSITAQGPVIHWHEFPIRPEDSLHADPLEAIDVAGVQHPPASIATDLEASSLIGCAIGESHTFSPLLCPP
jgi:hypothetical protein